MKYTFSALLFCLFLSSAHASQSTSGSQQQPLACERCTVILDEIHQTLSERCGHAPAKAELRQQTIYLFLSIFDEVSEGVDQEMIGRIYHAALEGMECDNLDAGVKAAQQMASKVVLESGSL